VNRALHCIVLLAAVGCASTPRWEPSYCSREFRDLLEDLALEVEISGFVPGQESTVGATIRNNGAEEIEFCLDIPVSLWLGPFIAGSARFYGLKWHGITTDTRCARKLFLKPGEGLNSVQRFEVLSSAPSGPNSLTAVAQVSRSPECVQSEPSHTLRTDTPVVISPAPVG
jgi:hypothetical protein